MYVTVPSLLQFFYRQTFKLPRMRTADVVKKEITDLENLLKGLSILFYFETASI